MPLNTASLVLILNEVSQPWVNRIICGLKNSKAKDTFGMDIMFLKAHKQSLIAPITSIINKSINKCVFPNSWKSAVIPPILKSGDPTIISHYRPISILPAISKIAEKWVAGQIIKHLNNSPYTLNPMQFGFRKYHSTETALCFLLENMKSKIDAGGVIGAVFIDLRKAFDTVNHQILMTKLSYFDLSLCTMKWIESYMVQRKQCVRVHNSKSATSKNPLGVPQSSILGPLLFSLYINDLPSSCTSNVTCQMYADDAVVYVHAKNKHQAAQDLSAAMINVSNWLQFSDLHLNVSKNVCMFFSKKASTDGDPDVFVHGTKLKIVHEFKYLGIVIDSQLCFKQQVKRTVNLIKCNLSNFTYIRNNLTIDSAKLYFNAMIVPYMTYCITTWSLACKSTLKPVEIAYKQALKTLDKKPRMYHHCSILKKFDLLSWENVIKYSDSILVYKIFHGLAPPPLKDFIKKNTNRSTRAASRGDCIVPFKKSVFGQSVFSYRASQTWNAIPCVIRDLPTFTSFTKHLKTWLLQNQNCNHNLP